MLTAPQVKNDKKAKPSADGTWGQVTPSMKAYPLTIELGEARGLVSFAPSLTSDVIYRAQVKVVLNSGKTIFGPPDSYSVPKGSQ